MTDLRDKGKSSEKRVAFDLPPLEFNQSSTVKDDADPEGLYQHEHSHSNAADTMYCCVSPDDEPVEPNNDNIELQDDDDKSILVSSNHIDDVNNDPIELQDDDDESILVLSNHIDDVNDSTDVHQDDTSPAPNHAPPSKRRKTHDEPELTRLRDIIGHGRVKLRIDEIILPLGLPMDITNSVLSGIRAVPASILLYGPPGCGKTKLARAIAGEARAAFFSVSPSDILSKFVGESEASVRNIFQKAVTAALQLESNCAVVFFDEIDALGQSRDNLGSGEGDGCSRKVLAELLIQLNVVADKKFCSLRDFGGSGPAEDAVDNTYDSDETTEQLQQSLGARIVTVAATNRMFDCDAALVRRFAIQLEVGYPTCRDRKKMFGKHIQGITHSICKEQFEYLAAITDQWSGSAIENLSREAAMAPVRECIRRAAVVRRRTAKFEQSGGTGSGEEDACGEPPDPDTVAHNVLLDGFTTLRPVTMDDFFEAIELITGDELPAATRLGRKKPVTDHYDSSSSGSEDDEGQLNKAYAHT